MLVLGVDPGMRNFGAALLRVPAGAQHPRDCEVLDMTSLWTDSRANDSGWGHRKSDSHADRTRLHVRSVRDMVGTSRPCLVCYEAFSSDRPVVMQQMGFVIGAMVALADTWDAPLISLTPKELKRAAVGRASASKPEVMAGVAKIMGPANAAAMADLMRPIPASRKDHAYDAVAAVMAGWDNALFRAARGAHLAAASTKR